MPKFFKRSVQTDVDLEADVVDNHDHFVKGARGANLRWCEDAVFAEAHDAEKWTVPDTRNLSWNFTEVFDALADGYDAFDGLEVDAAGVHKAIILAGKRAERRPGDQFEWNNRTYNLTNYKGKPILIPNRQMWGWYEQRKITTFKLNFSEEGGEEGDYDRVVFGTKDDHYTHYPEKYGFKGRRAIAREGTWKTPQYENRLQSRNPRRGKFAGKWLRFKTEQGLQNRWDEINEESGLRVKHAPCVLMINRFIKTYENFVATYLPGSQGTGTGRARPDHVTDHEIYRMFTGKHRKRILDNSLFADDTLVVLKVGKTKNAWWNKNQIARSFRIKNQN